MKYSFKSDETDYFNQLDFREAEKYYHRFQNKIFLIKYGGSALKFDELMTHFLESVARLHHRQIKVVLVHGGGPTLSQKMKEHNIQVKFKDGLRVSTKKTISLAIKVFSEINQKICQSLQEFSCDTQSFSQGECISATLLNSKDPDNRVGLVKNIKTQYLDLQKIPVISSLGEMIDSEAHGIDEDRLLNLNADQLAVSLSHHLQVRKLIYISDVNGIYRKNSDPSSKIDHITESEIRELVKNGILHGGMKLKVETALEALKLGVNKVHFIDGTIQNSLLYEILTDQGFGTEIVHDQ